MKIQRGWTGAYFVVFKDSIEAEKWHWLFWKILRRSTAHFGNFENAYHLFGPKRL